MTTPIGQSFHESSLFRRFFKHAVQSAAFHAPKFTFNPVPILRLGSTVSEYTRPFASCLALPANISARHCKIAAGYEADYLRPELFTIDTHKACIPNPDTRAVVSCLSAQWTRQQLSLHSCCECAADSFFSHFLFLHQLVFCFCLFLLFILLYDFRVLLTLIF